jgi:AcrR family transcriptional regulator
LLVYTREFTLSPVEGRKLLGRDERHASILRGAARAFARSGFAGTSMDDVAVEVGVSRLIVYRHFDSKEELYRAVLQRVFNRHAEEFVAGVEARDARALGAGAHLVVAREWPDGYVLLWRHAAREPQFAAYASELRGYAVEASAAVLASVGAKGDKRIERWAAETIVGFIVEAVLNWLDDGDPERDEELLDLVTDGVRAMRATWFACD